MGWFLTKKKGGKSRSAKSRGRAGSSASPKPWDPQRTLRGLKVLTGIALAAGAVVGWYYGEEALVDYAATMQADPVGLEDVVLVDAPAWMSPEVRNRVATVVAEQVSPDPLDGRSLRLAAEALAQEPWVARVEQVRRLAKGQVAVRAEYRQPVAIVEALDGYHLVDATGVQLPGLYYRDQVDRLGLPLLVNVAAAPPSRPGQQWAGEDLQAGLKLIQTLAGEPYFDQIEAFDVGQRDQRGRIRLALHTRDGMVLWGLPPGEEKTLEPAVATKLSWLRRLDRERGSIDAGGKIVHIYGASIATSEPIMHQHPGGATVYTLMNGR
jgi:hypothetical protein